MAPAGKVERFLGGDGGIAEAGSCSLPSPPFPGRPRWSCRHRRRHTRAFSWRPWEVTTRPWGQSHGREQAEKCPPGCLCHGGRGKGGRPYGSREDYCSVCTVEVAGVCVCACAWPKWGANVLVFGEGQPHLGGALLTGWLLGGLAPHLHPWPVCYVRKHPHACSRGMAGATMVSRCIAHGSPSQRGVHAPAGQEVSAWCPGSTGREGRSCPTWEQPFSDAISARSPAVLPKDPAVRAALPPTLPSGPPGLHCPFLLLLLRCLGASARLAGQAESLWHQLT